MNQDASGNIKFRKTNITIIIKKGGHPEMESKKLFHSIQESDPIIPIIPIIPLSGGKIF